MKKRDNYNEYMRKYMLARYHRRREAAILLLGGKCARCGSGSDLQLDHKDPNSKAFSVARCHSASEELWNAEIAKCQLLCGDCHRRKTTEDNHFQWGKGRHGTEASYRYCGPPRCAACKQARSEAVRRRKQHVKSSTSPDPLSSGQ